MKKILVVEDEYYARKSIVKILQESDLDIQVCGEAVNGMKAIELLEEYKDIALVITDIQMKKMGGLELAANYAQTECQFRYCGTAIPFLTVRSTAR